MLPPAQRFSWCTLHIIAFSIWNFVGKVMSLLFNMLSRFVKAFLPRSKCLFHFMASVIVCSNFGAQEKKICYCFYFFPSLCHEVRGPDVEVCVLSVYHQVAGVWEKGLGRLVVITEWTFLKNLECVLLNALPVLFYLILKITLRDRDSGPTPMAALKSHNFTYLYTFSYLFIYLASLGLRCGTWDL